jgi:hypothetical protein
MNDGISKMAEYTAGYPFQLEVFVNSEKRYAKHNQGRIALRVNAIPHDGRTVRLGRYSKNELFLISSSSPVFPTVSDESMKEVDVLDDYVMLDASKCDKGTTISMTLIVEEVKDGYVSESRGYSTLILIV